MKPYHIVIAHDQMGVMNEDGDSLACFSLDAGYAAAKRQIRKWSIEYAIYIGEAYATLDEYFYQLQTK